VRALLAFVSAKTWVRISLVVAALALVSPKAWGASRSSETARTSKPRNTLAEYPNDPHAAYVRSVAAGR